VHRKGVLDALATNITVLHRKHDDYGKPWSESDVQVPIAGWYEAFAAHPALGDAAAVQAKFQSAETSSFMKQSTLEQSGMIDAVESLVKELAEWNNKFEGKFGHIFILCASGKSAEEVLAALKRRYRLSAPCEH
jgi:hypothetical protein